MRGSFRFILYLVTIAASVAFALSLARAATPDLKPPQVTVNYIFSPRPLLQDHSTRLYYEMVVTNFIPLDYQLESVEADAAAKRFIFTGDTLKGMTRIAGLSADASHSLTIAAGRTVIIFMELDFDHPWEVPATIRNILP
jgi:hypothetical protein